VTTDYCDVTLRYVLFASLDCLLTKDVNKSRNARVLKKNYCAREFNFSTSEKFTYAQGEIMLTKLTVIRLKMICNDFLVVKLNCWSYVFNTQ